MDFPYSQLALLLQVITGKASWDGAAFDAALEVIKFAYHNFIDNKPKIIGDESVSDFDAEATIKELIASKDAKGVTPAIWISLALWLANKIIERMSK
jgi:hypothetical protein